MERVYHPKTTFSELFRRDLEGKETLICMAIELPWLKNKRRESCVPEGVYPIVRTNSPKFGIVPMVKDVQERTRILFHAANDADNTDGESDLLGCIAPVTWIRINKDTIVGMESRNACRIVLSQMLLDIERGPVEIEIIKKNLLL